MRQENSSNKILIIVIAVLLVANIATLSYLFLSGKKNTGDDRRNAMRNYLKNDLKFSDAQIVLYDTLKSKHRAGMRDVFENMRLRKQENFKVVGEFNFSDTALLIAADAAASEQVNMEMKMLKHLKDIRSICTPDQLKKFDTGFYRVITKPYTEPKKN